jgi:hypothetical protein
MNRNCSNCGKQLREGDLFCRECGNRVFENEMDNKETRFKWSKKKIIILAISFIMIAIIITSVLLLIPNNDKKKISLTSLPNFTVAKYVPSNVHVDSVIKMNLKNNDISEYLVFGIEIDKDRLFALRYFGLFSFDNSINAWRKDYSDYTGECEHSIDTGSIDAYKKKIVILSDSHGSGGFLDYKVLGYNNDSLRIYMSREGIYQGSVYFLGNQIIEQKGQKSIAYSYNGETFIGIPLISTPYGPLDINDVKLEYSIDDQNNVSCPIKVRIKQGFRLFLVRNEGGPSEKIFYPGKVLEIHKNYYLAKNLGNDDFIIEPSGDMDWSKSKKISVEVYR